LKKIFNTALITLVFLAFSAQARAVVLNKDFLKEKIKKEVEEQLKSEKRTSVEISELPYEKIEIDAGKNDKVEIDAKINTRFFNPVTVVRVNILVNGSSQKSFIAQAKINTYDKVWVAKDYIQRGSIFSGVVLEEKEISYLPKTYAKKDFNPYKYVARKNYKPEDVIDVTYVEKIPAIVRNSPVSVIFKTDSVSVTIPAIALEQGGLGDFIKVRSQNYRKDYLGKIISENTVLVNI